MTRPHWPSFSDPLIYPLFLPNTRTGPILEIGHILASLHFLALCSVHTIALVCPPAAE